MNHNRGKWSTRIIKRKCMNWLLKGLIVALFLILAVAFTVSITYSMIMKENFYRNKVNGGKKEYNKSFLVVMYQTSDDFLEKFREGVSRQAAEKQIFIDFVNVENINEAIGEINTAVAAKVDGIIAQGIYESNYIQALNEAVEKGIIVEFVYTDAWGVDRACFVGYNAYDYGKMASRSAIKQLDVEEGDIALMVQSVTDNEKDVTGGLFIEGFKSIVDKYPKVNLVEILRTSYDMFSAEDVTYDILNRYPDIDAIVCTSERDAFGVAQVIIDLNRVGDIKIVGAGVSSDIIRYIELEVIAASFDMNPEIMSELCIETMTEGEVSGDYFETPLDTVTSDNVHRYKK